MEGQFLIHKKWEQNKWEIWVFNALYNKYELSHLKKLWVYHYQFSIVNGAPPLYPRQPYQVWCHWVLPPSQMTHSDWCLCVCMLQETWQMLKQRARWAPYSMKWSGRPIIMSLRVHVCWSTQSGLTSVGTMVTISLLVSPPLLTPSILSVNWM